MNEVFLLNLESASKPRESITAKTLLDNNITTDQDEDKNRDNFKFRIMELDTNINQVKVYRDAILADLINKKRLLKCLSDPYNTVIYEDQLDKLISSLAKEHTKVLDQLLDKSEMLKSAMSFTSLDDILNELDREISRIQLEYSTTLEMLDVEKQDVFNELQHVGSFYNMLRLIEDEMMLTDKKYSVIRSKMLEEREELLKRTDLSPSELSLRLQLLDQEIGNVSDECIGVMATLVSQRNDVHSESKEALYQYLVLRGITISPTGQIILTVNDRTKVLSWTDAINKGYFVGIEPTVAKLVFSVYLSAQQLHLTTENRILTKSGIPYTVREAYDSGLLDGIDIDLYYFVEREYGDVPSQLYAKIFKTPSNLGDEEARPMEENELRRKLEEITAPIEDDPDCIPVISYEDCRYLKEALGKPLALALGEITTRLPTDPVHYLSHWLFKYRYNKSIDPEKMSEAHMYTDIRNRADEEQRKQKVEKESENILLDVLLRVELEATDRQIRRQLKLYVDENYSSSLRRNKRLPMYEPSSSRSRESLHTEKFQASVNESVGIDTFQKKRISQVSRISKKSSTSRRRSSINPPKRVSIFGGLPQVTKNEEIKATESAQAQPIKIGSQLSLNVEKNQEIQIAKDVISDVLENVDRIEHDKDMNLAKLNRRQSQSSRYRQSQVSTEGLLI